MRITILCVGKFKERFWTEAAAEYIKRLSRYCDLKIVEVADEPTPENASEKLERQIKDKEGARLSAWLSRHVQKQGSLTIALAIKGRRMDSPAFASFIEEAGAGGISHLVFVIGGSLGLSDQVLSVADRKLSFSDLTFPHQLMRVILLEQVYRAFRIINRQPYHK